MQADSLLAEPSVNPSIYVSKVHLKEVLCETTQSHDCYCFLEVHFKGAVILEPPKIKSDTVSTVSPSISHEVMGSDAMILVF